MKLDFPATSRNREPITDVLARVLPSSGLVVELASGSGQHCAWFAEHLAPALRWQPSDPDPSHRDSIAAWCDGLANVYAPRDLDALEPGWPAQLSALPEPIAAILCINMIHIAPWDACLGLVRGAAALLATAGEASTESRLGPGGLLFLYGPFMLGGQHTAPSNAAFDASLKSRNPAWGVRDLDVVRGAAEAHGFALVETVTMPANNLSVIFRRLTT